MDTSVHQSLYEQGLEMRKKVVGEDYVATALEKGSGDFMRPLQQFATVSSALLLFFFKQLDLMDLICTLGDQLSGSTICSYTEKQTDSHTGISMGNNLDTPRPLPPRSQLTQPRDVDSDE